MKKNISYDIHSHSISETLVSLCIAHSFSPSVGESLESFAFGRSESSNNSIKIISIPVLFFIYSACPSSASDCVCNQSCFCSYATCLTCLCWSYSICSIYSVSLAFSLIELFNIFWVACGERKYFGSGCSSKMSDNEHSLPVLWHSVIFAVKHLPLTVIPQLINRGDDGAESFSVVMTEQSFNIFKDE